MGLTPPGSYGEAVAEATPHSLLKDPTPQDYKGKVLRSKAPP
jgi:hypothetical protein